MWGRGGSGYGERINYIYGVAGGPLQDGNNDTGRHKLHLCARPPKLNGASSRQW